MKENNLMELEVLYRSTARLIAHPLSYRVNPYGLKELIDRLRDQAKAVTV
ncbi:MAG: hypothetical protein WBG38_08420 [Nodosilinea sp.]